LACHLTGNQTAREGIEVMKNEILALDFRAMLNDEKYSSYGLAVMVPGSLAIAVSIERQQLLDLLSPTEEAYAVVETNRVPYTLLIHYMGTLTECHDIVTKHNAEE
jgi:hypothetical protein